MFEHNSNTKKYIQNYSNKAKELISSSFKNVLLKLSESKKIKNIKILFQTSQDKLERSFKNDNENIVLKQSDKWMRYISWTLMGSTFFGISWLVIATTEEIVIATGQLEPTSKVANIQIPLQGITKEILVSEGDKVKQGQVLIKLDTEATQSRQNALESILQTNIEILENMDNLAKEGAVSRIDYLVQKSKVTEIETQVVEGKVTLRKQKIIAPTDGIIFDLKARRPGYVAQTSEPILKIVPFDKLRAKVEIESRNIGFVSVGKKADISIDSYPSTDFGVIQGTVSSIGSDALPPDPRMGKGYRFPTIISLDSQSLKLKNGNILPLQVGMSLTANIKLRKVTYLQLLLSNFTEKANSLREL